MVRVFRKRHWCSYAGLLLICMIPTSKVVASVFIVPCIYSLIGAYPGILKLSAVHEGINECLLCCVSKTCPLSSLWDFQIHADPWRRIFQSYYIFPETSLLLGFCNAMIFTNIFLAFSHSDCQCFAFVFSIFNSKRRVFLFLHTT